MAAKKIRLRQIQGHQLIGANAAGDQIMIDGDAPQPGLSPMEMLLVALGTCTAYNIIDIMQKKRQPLAHYQIDLEGEQADTYPKRYVRIHMTHTGSGPEVTENAFRRAIELSHTKYCAVAASLNAEIEETLVIEPWTAKQAS